MAEELADAVAEAQPRLAHPDLEDPIQDRQLGQLHRDDRRDVLGEAPSRECSTRSGLDPRGQVDRPPDGLRSDQRRLGKLPRPDDRPEDRVREQLGAPPQVGLVVTPEGECGCADPRTELGDGPARSP